MNANITKDINYTKVSFSIGYLLLGIAIIYFFHEKIFYTVVQNDSYNFYRFIWCLSSSAIGFSFLVFQLRFDLRSPLPSYLVYYPVLLIVISAIIFSILHIFKNTSGFVFYYFSFSLCFILSYLVDQFWDIITTIVSRFAK